MIAAQIAKLTECYEIAQERLAVAKREQWAAECYVGELETLQAGPCLDVVGYRSGLDTLADMGTVRLTEATRVLRECEAEVAQYGPLFRILRMQKKLGVCV